MKDIKKTMGLKIAIVIIVTVFSVIAVIRGENHKKDNNVYDINVICWGDSLTEGIGADFTDYPKELSKLIETKQAVKVNVVNEGISGESSISIAVRAGGIPIYTTDKVEYSFLEDEKVVNFLTEDRQIAEPWHDPKWNDVQVEIAGIRGKLFFSSEEYSYFFKRNNQFEKSVIPENSQIEIIGVERYKDYIPVIFIGQNGIYKDAYDLITQQKSIITKEQEEMGRYLILGLTYGSYEDNYDMEEVMALEYGRNYINLREFLCEYVKNDSQIALSDEDIVLVEAGTVPGILRNEDDMVHLNDKGYELVARAVYERMEELLFFQ